MNHSAHLPRTAHPWSIYGHDWAVRLLQRSVASGQNPAQGVGGRGPLHAYLFLGPTQVGKTTLAKAFAAALLCTGEEKPCGACRSCRLLSKSSHPDFRLVQPVDREGEIDRADGMLRVEQAAEIIHAASLQPMEGRFKFFLIQDAHLANDSFANKMLKTLEEPSAHVVICITALDRASLLPTVVSRCQVIELRPSSAPAVEAALVQRWDADPDQAQLLARLSNGRLGWAVRQLKDEDAWQQRQDQLQTLWQLMADDNARRLAFSGKLGQRRDTAQLFGLIELWTGWWRDILLTQNGHIEACGNVDLLDKIASHAAVIPPQKVAQFIQTLRRVEGYLHHTVNVRLALDILLLALPRLDAAATD